jgi:peptidoglycan hydrolase-like protein with peptidoglycan-binding domain
MRLLVVAAAVAVALGGCSHTRSVAPAEEPAPTKESKKESAKEEPLAPSKTTPSSPAALLAPGAARDIQEKLAKSGDLDGAPSGELDGPTRAALARFQRAHDLPATGIPDDATVEKLGLQPAAVFKKTGAGQEK